MIKLDKLYLKEIKETILQSLPKATIKVFGSRVNGTAQEFSDIDIAIDNKQKINEHIIQELKDKFSESQLPILVDILDLNNIDKSFKDIINKRFEIL